MLVYRCIRESEHNEHHSPLSQPAKIKNKIPNLGHMPPTYIGALVYRGISISVYIGVIVTADASKVARHIPLSQPAKSID